MTELEFRDGTRLVPDHVAAMMDGLETYRLTWDEAMAIANKGLLTRTLNDAQQSAVRKHFTEGNKWHR